MIPQEVKDRVKDLELFMKGHRGAIYTGVYEGMKVAVKVQREDIDAMGTVDMESLRIKELNKFDIGPRLLFSGNNFIVYEFVKGKMILDFFEDASRSQIVSVLRDVMKQMFLMDVMGLNKEEMHHPLKHVIVQEDGKAVLLDFERCKPNPKVHNVTQFVQFLNSGKLRPVLEKHEIEIDKDKMLHIAQEYSRCICECCIGQIMDMLR